MTFTIGILALQGAFIEHAHILERLSCPPKTRLVKAVHDLDGIDALILPGGESTTMSLLLRSNHLVDAVVEFCKTKPVFATCAGLILLARDHFNLLDVKVERNAYGRQVDSHRVMCRVDTQNMKCPWDGEAAFQGVFIRAPRIVDIGSKVAVLSEREWTEKDRLVKEGKVESGWEPVIVQQGVLLGAACHPELTLDTRWHAYFMSIVEKFYQ